MSVFVPVFVPVFVRVFVSVFLRVFVSVFLPVVLSVLLAGLPPVGAANVARTRRSSRLRAWVGIGRRIARS